MGGLWITVSISIEILVKRILLQIFFRKVQHCVEIYSNTIFIINLKFLILKICLENDLKSII